jgi:phenylacetic acid degradation operon negative regulatory protein
LVRSISNQKNVPLSFAAFSPRNTLEKLRVLQPQEVILGLFGEYVKPREKVWSGGLVNLLQDLNFSPAAARVALSRVVARRLFTRSKYGKFVYYTISPRLELVHREGRQQTFSIVADPKWHGNWTVVWYSIPERMRFKRARLSRWLSFRGFASLQDGTWITPGDRELDVASLSRALGLDNHIITFVARLGKSRTPASLVRQIWNLDALQLAYDALAREFAPYARKSSQNRISDRDAFIVRTRAIEMFRRTTSQDPRLPDSLLGMRWKRRDVIGSFNLLYHKLAPAAERYFRLRALPDDKRNT